MRGDLTKFSRPGDYAHRICAHLVYGNNRRFLIITHTHDMSKLQGLVNVTATDNYSSQHALQRQVYSELYSV
jgi:hypothetical protein